jgi:hypothetical protein
MKVIVLFLSVLTLCACLVSGCLPLPGDNRLEVNDTLRQACQAAGASDNYIQILISMAESSRLAGDAAETASIYLGASCGVDPSCTPCVNAIIAQVYGN